MRRNNNAVGPLPPQGTRASVAMGHIGGPKQPPTPTQYGGDESIQTTTGNTSQVRGWPANPGREIAGASGTRESLLRTDPELQTGPPPKRVIRQLFARVYGAIGPEGVYGFPYNGDRAFVPHMTVPRSAQRTSGPLYKTRDDNAPIPAIYAGNPR